MDVPSHYGIDGWFKKIMQKTEHFLWNSTISEPMDKQLTEAILETDNWIRQTYNGENTTLDSYIGSIFSSTVAITEITEKRKYLNLREYILTYVGAEKVETVRYTRTIGKEMGGESTYGDKNVQDMFNSVKSKYQSLPE
jgi:hypothetical protein